MLGAELELGGTVDHRLLWEDLGISISITCCHFIYQLYIQTFFIDTYEGISHSDESWINIGPEHQPFLNTNSWSGKYKTECNDKCMSFTYYNVNASIVIGLTGGFVGTRGKKCSSWLHDNLLCHNSSRCHRNRELNHRDKLKNKDSCHSCCVIYVNLC